MPNLSAATLSSFGHLLWHCADCREVFRATPFDDAPQYTVQDGTVVEEACDEREGFLLRHHHHRLGFLKRIRDKILSDRPAWDPMRTVYEEVTDGQETFLLKSWREDISAPRRHLLLSGSLVVEGISISLEEEPLRSALRRSCPFPAAILDRLTAVIQKTVVALPPEDLIPAYGSGTDPNLFFAYLSGHHLDLLLHRCLQAVGKEDLAHLRRFFLARHYSEELTVAVRQKLQPRFA